MNPDSHISRAATIRRWIDVLSIGALASVGYLMLVRPALVPWVGPMLDEARNSFGHTGLLACTAAIILVLVPLHRLAGSRIRHFWFVLRYPPLGVAVIAGLAMLNVLPRLIPETMTAGLSWPAAIAAALLYLATLVVSAFRFPAFTRRPDKPTSIPSADAFTHWLDREEPIDEFTQDRFGHADIAIRLVDRLTSGESTIALQGAYGSGKSGLCRLAEIEAARRNSRLRFVFASCWGFEKTESAQRHVLESILSAVSDEVDALAIHQLPTDYLEAVTADISWLKALFKLGVGEPSPVEQLQRFSSILAAIDRRIVVVIEDVDRTGEDFDIGRIQSLLMQFREVPGLSFILAISPLQQVDFVKLCDHLEMIPPLEPSQVLSLLDEVRELAFKEHPPAVVLAKLDPLRLSDRDSRSLHYTLEYYWPWQLALAEILNRPRILKHALRRIRLAWAHLSGEVHFDHLISVAALRAGAPSVYAFLTDHYQYFAPVAKPPDAHLRQDARIPLKEHLRRDWRRLCATRQFHVLGATGLLHDILPSTGAVTGLVTSHTVILQSAQSERRGSVYARRLFTERTEPNEISDQAMLDLLKRVRTEPPALRQLAEAIATSNFASTAFEHFISLESFSQHLPLVSEIYAYARRSLPVGTDGGDLPGFIAAWRTAGNPRPDGFEAWLLQEIKIAAEAGTHFRLLSDIYYYWLDTNKHNRPEREAVRRKLVDTLKATWSSLPPGQLAVGFPPDFPWVLFHLIFTTDYERPAEVPLNTMADWSWSAEPLLKAAEVRPDLVLPQILNVLNTDSLRGGERLRYKLDEARLNEWFGAQRPLLFRLAAQFSIPPALTAQAQYLTKLALEEIAALSDKKE